MNKIDETVEMFQSMDNEFRLQMLLDYAEKLPPLPEKYQEKSEIESHRVHECMTPVSVWVENVAGKVQIYADAPRESPTVRGFISLLIQHFNGETPQSVLNTSVDLIQKSGLADAIGMRRIQGLSALLERVLSDVKNMNA